MRHVKSSKQSLLDSIAKANEEEIREAFYMLLRKQEEKYPDYEMIVFSLPKFDTMARESALEDLKMFMRKHCCSK